MMKMSIKTMRCALGLWLLALAPALRAQNVTCDCDPSRPDTLQERGCSLTREALRQPETSGVFFLKDTNPRKPGRWLALPKRHAGPGMHTLEQLTPAERRELWTGAIAKARELFGEEWGVAYNGDKVRTQCHLHIHIGKFITAAELPRALVIRSVDQIPVPKGDGLWIHACQGNKMCVHAGEQITETVLVR